MAHQAWAGQLGRMLVRVLLGPLAPPSPEDWVLIEAYLAEMAERDLAGEDD